MRTPARNSDVYFVGAGLASAFGIPNTQQLLDSVHVLAATNSYWSTTTSIAQRLETAYDYFYPIQGAVDSGFRPNVVDFFSVLKTYESVSRGLPGRLEGTRDLMRDLKRALANVLVNHLREADALLLRKQPVLDEILTPGNLVVTSNWDFLLERYAQHHNIPLRHSIQEPAQEVTLLKLHGSIDWCLASECRRPRGVKEYRTLRERLFGPRPYVIKPGTTDNPLRMTALENWSQAWSRIKSRAGEPLMITMALGKAADLEELRPVWRDAYSAISRAKTLRIVGYSLPEDDLEIRTLLVAGIERAGSGNVDVVVQNPSPEVHDRFRQAVTRRMYSEYKPVAAT